MFIYSLNNSVSVFTICSAMFTGDTKEHKPCKEDKNSIDTLHLNGNVHSPTQRVCMFLVLFLKESLRPLFTMYGTCSADINWLVVLQVTCLSPSMATEGLQN